MKSMIAKFLLVSSTSLLLACSSPISEVIVSPELNIASSNFYQQKQAKLRFSDLRTSNHIVQILRIGKATKTYPAQEPIINLVEASLTSAFQDSGLRVQPLAANQIHLIIDNALVSVQQELTKYSASNHMNFRVVINNGENTLTKSFKMSGNSIGPLTADIAVLERDFNQQLAKLLTQIVQSKEVQQFLR
ncbi:MAG: YajG family lipoprotein [Cognaticolwellia sp.]